MMKPVVPMTAEHDQIRSPRLRLRHDGMGDIRNLGAGFSDDCAGVQPNVHGLLHPAVKHLPDIVVQLRHGVGLKGNEAAEVHNRKKAQVSGLLPRQADGMRCCGLCGLACIQGNKNF
ncbi:hypothetical protein GALL_393120 [mine drainage metagenome]|uniref:Uncharacterized protein n=1 Tax=mine drainage metagenome TaxID=410659 RepID=A0A1J5Q5K1_9ZZZZ